MGTFDLWSQPLFLHVRTLSPENFREQAAGTQARNHVLSVSLAAQFLAEEESLVNVAIFALKCIVPSFLPKVAAGVLGERPSSPSQAHYHESPPPPPPTSGGLAPELLPTHLTAFGTCGLVTPPLTYLLAFSSTLTLWGSGGPL